MGTEGSVRCPCSNVMRRQSLRLDYYSFKCVRLLLLLPSSESIQRGVPQAPNLKGKGKAVVRHCREHDYLTLKRMHIPL